MKKKNIIIVNSLGVIVTGVTRVDGGWMKLLNNQQGQLVEETYYEPHWGVDNIKNDIFCPITLEKKHG